MIAVSEVRVVAASLIVRVVVVAAIDSERGEKREAIEKRGVYATRYAEQ